MSDDDDGLARLAADDQRQAHAREVCRAAEQRTTEDAVRHALADWLDAHPGASMHLLRLYALRDDGTDKFCCWQMAKPDALALGRVTGVAIDPETGFWRYTTAEVLADDDTPVVLDEIPATVHETAAGWVARACRPGCPTAAACAAQQRAWRTRQ